MERAARFALFLGLWLVLADGWSGLGFGLLAAALATWASVRLMPGRMGLHPIPALRLIGRTAAQTLLAGTDIARRALDPRLPLRPGMVAHATALPEGMARDGFTALASLAPGALPAGTEGDVVMVHALDTRLPVAADLAATEALYAQAQHG
ncbi:Na+/H+ antiporter subunit E [Roseococcus sp. SDR]|uniref:Na+/H+ antiporter subunit E n=1 Tax=Roseococcus sp. SDR TaxID=2835532 RepID=UPI001BCFD301|nr:Na+/H+ antiporter subunit E [Roseococcus sp. SDR]MBS7792960.1 Na+/H+ antiporter subunit E [Roseococcus sp. SDR]MBV1848274.1 Na+/H+ antiporter subunit E [Roseococcus sp. SDR]